MAIPHPVGWQGIAACPRPRVSFLQSGWWLVGRIVLSTVAPVAMSNDDASSARRLCARLFVGTYSEVMPHVAGKGKGVYLVDLWCDASLTLREPGVVACGPNASYVVACQEHKCLLAVSEVDDGQVDLFKFDCNATDTGSVVHCGRCSSHGAWPCHIALLHRSSSSCSPSSESPCFGALVANYGAGVSWCEFGVSVNESDGSYVLSEARAKVEHEGTSGSGVVTSRQMERHAHSSLITPCNRFVYVADLGQDAIHLFELSSGVPTLKCATKCAPGSGPRHMAFHPSRRVLFVLNELDNTVSTFSMDEESFQLAPMGSPVSTLPEGWKGTNHTADIHVHPNGSFVYASNRGHDSICVLKVSMGEDSNGVVLHAQEWESTKGKTPRSLFLSRCGNILLAANQDTDTIESYRVNAESGSLHHQSNITVPTPVSITPFYV